MTKFSVKELIPASLRKLVPDKIKRTIKDKLIVKTPLEKDVALFILEGKRFTPPLSDFPPMVMIDTTTRCNLTCEHCPNSALSEVKDFLGDMEDDLVYKILDEIAREAPDTLTRLFNGGEPLMRKDLKDHIQYAREKGIKAVSINTNGTMLVKSRRQGIIEAGLTHIEVSVDAFTPETYLKIRKSTLFDRVVQNTLDFIQESKAHNPENQVTVSMVLQTDNRHEHEQFLAFWEPKVDHVYIREYHQHNANVDDHGLFKNHGNPRRHPCPFLWDRIIVNHDGMVRFCEFDWMGEHALGDAKENTLKEIWQGEAFTRLRESHVEGTFCHEFCKNCTDWRQINWNGMK
ncbi:MAG: radical SAM protein [Planctomycetota bacterium]|nr:radical SAM protein [Planctomycetota bacterium]